MLESSEKRALQDSKNSGEGELSSNESSEEQLKKIWQTLLEKQSAASDLESSTEQVPLDKKADDKASSELAINKNQKQRDWPSYDAVMSGIAAADYNQILTCPMDMIGREDEGKTLCPHGVVCFARLELFEAPPYEDRPYTGILKPGSSWDHCLLRLSSALQPPGDAVTSPLARTLLYTTGEKLRTAQLFPMTALKVFVNDNNSRNALFGGSKVGQRETDFFAHCQCTTMTERMPSLAKPLCRKFWNYSKWPLSLGLSDFCRPLDNNATTDVHFPFALILKPTIQSDEPKQHSNTTDNGGNARNAFKGRGSLRWSAREKNAQRGSFDSFLDFSLTGIPEETHLFDVFACPTPNDVADAAKLQRIGRIVTTSNMVESTPNDGLFFKHQAKEEDYALRPDWPEALKQAASVENGKVKGTIGTLAGWQIFEEQIDKKQYVDFEYGKTG